MSIPTGSTYFAIENEALKARVTALQALCKRAANALEFWMYDVAASLTDYEQKVIDHKALVTELREAS
jgi:hypothetical protein